MNENRTTITTAEGVVVPIKPISIFEMQLAIQGLERYFRESGKPIDTPTYTVTTVAGEVEKHVHDETSLEVKPEYVLKYNPGLTAEQAEQEAKRQTEANKAAWAEHISAVNEYQKASQDLQTRFMLEGVDIPLPDDNAWEVRQKKLYIQVPDDPEEKLFHYRQTVVLRTASDLADAFTAITKLSMSGIVSEEAVDAVRDQFRDSLSAAGRGNGQAAGQSETASGPLGA